MTNLPHFDPDAAAKPGAGIFGLPFSREQSRIVILPVPFDATTSYGNGTAAGPAAVRAASAQVDLFDIQFGNVYEQSIFMLEPDAEIAALSAKARALAEPLIAKGGAEDSDHAAVETINAAGQAVNVHTHQHFSGILAEGKIPALLGGDHSTPFGAILACAEHVNRATSGREGLGILHIDAHMDLRDAFEGFLWSHASIMFNVLERIPQVSRLVQVGIRDFGKGEFSYAESADGRAGPRVVPHFDLDWSRRLDAGERFAELARQAIEELPRNVYISFDIDALEPMLCPHTGTPVPGGLTFNRACMLLETLAHSGRTVVGFDLVEVAPGPNPDEPEWDANVGARILYKLCGVAGFPR
jgi:agmatinase